MTNGWIAVQMLIQNVRHWFCGLAFESNSCLIKSFHVLCIRVTFALVSALEILQGVSLYPSKSKTITAKSKIPAVRCWMTLCVVQEALLAFAVVQ